MHSGLKELPSLELLTSELVSMYIYANASKFKLK